LIYSTHNGNDAPQNISQRYILPIAKQISISKYHRVKKCITYEQDFLYSCHHMSQKIYHSSPYSSTIHPVTRQAPVANSSSETGLVEGYSVPFNYPSALSDLWIEPLIIK